MSIAIHIGIAIAEILFNAIANSHKGVTDFMWCEMPAKARFIINNKTKTPMEYSVSIMISFL